MPAIRMSFIHDLAADAGRDLDPSELSWMLDDDVHAARRATTVIAEHGAHYGSGNPHYVPGAVTLDGFRRGQPADEADEVQLLEQLPDRAAGRHLN